MEFDPTIPVAENVVRDLKATNERQGAEIAQLRRVAGDLVQEWDSYIGGGVAEGHHDPDRVGEKVAAVRATLSRTNDPTPWGVQP